MNKIINNILIQSGWFNGRKVPINDIVNYWENKKYTLYPNQISFIEEFNNLKLRFKNINNHNYTININPLVNDIPLFALKKYIEYANADLVCFGEIISQDTFLLITQDAKIYGAFEDEIVLMGNNFYDFLENLYIDKDILWHSIKNFYQGNQQEHPHF